MMYDGRIKMVQDIVVGDLIMGDDSTPRTVLSLSRGREMLYDVVPTKGEPYTVNESHILSLLCSHTSDSGIVDMDVREFLKLPHDYRDKVFAGYRVPIEFSDTEVDISPYSLGYWLGNGNIDLSLIHI